METTIAICVPLLVWLVQMLKKNERFAKSLPLISIPMWMILVIWIGYWDLTTKQMLIAGIVTALTANWMYDQWKIILTLFSKKD